MELPGRGLKRRVAERLVERGVLVERRHELLGLIPRRRTTPVLDGSAPVQHVVRDHDGEWQLMSGVPGDEEEVHVVHLFHALDRDQSLLEILDLEVGERADRDAPDGPWERQTLAE